MNKSILLLLAVAVPLFAQQPQQNTPASNTPQPQEVIVRVQTEAPKPPTPPPDKTVVQKANEWVDFGRNVGTAMDAGLTSLTDHADKFSKTDAGKFTMAVIAWKIAGRDAMELTRYVTERAVKLFFGIPLLIGWCWFGIWWIRRMYVPHRVVTSRQGWLWWAKKEYKWLNLGSSEDGYRKGWGEGKVAGCLISCVGFAGIGLLITFTVIL